jgi:hypothetical protein
VTLLLLNDMEKSVGLTELATEQEFMSMLKIDHAIVYISVDWSGPERVSRYLVYKALHELDKKKVPVFKIDCSLQENKYVEEWLRHPTDGSESLYSGGWGETLFIVKGKMLDFIRNPGKEKPNHVKEKLKGWIDLCDK